MLISLLVLPALAGIPVVHDGGDPAAHVAAAAERTGLPADQLTAIDVSTLLDEPPSALGKGVVRRCARTPARMTDVRTQLVRADAAVAEGDAVSVFDHLDLALAQLGCLTEVADPDEVALGFLLRGALAAEQGDTEAAQSEIRTALAFDADVVWPPGYPVAGQEILAAELTDQIRHDVRVVPDDTGAGPWVDGAEVGETTPLAEGLHLIQYGSRQGLQSAWMVVDGPAALVVPDRFPARVLDTFLDAEAHQEAALLLAAALDDFEAAYVAHRDGLWLVVAESAGASVEELVAGEPLPVVVEQPEPEPKGKKGRRRTK